MNDAGYSIDNDNFDEDDPSLMASKNKKNEFKRAYHYTELAKELGL